MNKTKHSVLIIFAVIVVGCLLYLPGLNGLGLPGGLFKDGLGFYRDAWNYFYNLTVRGPETLIRAFNADRPADGYLIAVLYRLFGTNINAYLIWCICCRILSSIFFALALLHIWPNIPKMAGLAGVLAVAFPGFLQQVDAITYLPHQTAMVCFMLSLLLTVLACTPGQKTWNVLFTFLSMLLSFASMMLMEYYVGMEIYRFGLIYMMNREQAGNGKPKSFFKCLLSYIPYLIPMVGFVAWRTLIFSAQRAGTDVATEIIKPFMEHPRHEIADLGVRTIKNVWKLFAGVWTIPAFRLANGLEMKTFIKALVPSVIILAAGQFFLFLMHRRRTDETVSAAINESSQWIWYGLICGTVSILPLIISGRDINFSASLDRFAWPGMIGTILFLAGLLGSLKDRTMRNVLTMVSILLAVFVQWQNQVNYIDIWKNSKDYWQQLIWRAPGMEPGTTIVSAGEYLAEEDYEIFAPASMIYYPNVDGWAPVSAEILNENTIRDVKLGNKVYRKIREIYTEKDYKQLLAVSKPYAKSCLRVIDGRNPIYSLDEWSRIPEIGSYSKLEQIQTIPEEPSVMPFFLGEEQEHGWCYYYEKMELALQMDDPQTAAGLADEAASLNLSTEDAVELIPVIEAYVQTGRTEDALPAAEKLKANDYMALNAVNYFEAKEDSAAYSGIIDVLTGKEDEAEETVPETDPAEGSADQQSETDMSDEDHPSETETTDEVLPEQAGDNASIFVRQDLVETPEPASGELSQEPESTEPSDTGSEESAADPETVPDPETPISEETNTETDGEIPEADPEKESAAAEEEPAAENTPEADTGEDPAAEEISDAVMEKEPAAVPSPTPEAETYAL